VGELGAPIAYLVLKEGTPVYDREGNQVGVVEHVLSDEPVDIFHGLIVHTLPLPGRHLVATAHQIAELRERGVLLSVDREDLHEATPAPPPRDTNDAPMDGPLRAGLRRAWDWLRRQR
jgi:hypothetical protein